MAKKDTNDLEYKILKMIKDAEDAGILQSEVWKLIGATSRASVFYFTN